MTKFAKDTLESPTGANIRLYVSDVPSPKAVLHISHGMSEHGLRYERFAKALAERGYASIAQDHRGHGETTAPDAPIGTFAKSDGWEKVIADAHAVNGEIKQRFPRTPMVLFGHSMGSIIGVNYCIRHSDSIDAAALWNSGNANPILQGVYVFLLAVERMFRGSDVTSKIANILAFDAWNKKFAPNRTASDWLSRDEAEVDKYVADPLCGFDVSNGLWRDLIIGIKAAADDQEIAKIRKDLPVHLLAGKKDPCTDDGEAVERLHNRMQKVGIKDLTLRLLEDTRHESLNETNRDETTAEFIDWLDQRFAS